MPDSAKRLIIIDGHALIYRAYHAFPALSSPEGVLVNAVYGFSRILLTVVRDFRPHYLGVAFDHKGPTKRSLQYVSYKANRAPMPDDLRPQIQIVKDFVDTLSIPRFELEGYEADDLIGTIAKQVEAENKKTPILIVTGDKDLLQLVTDQTHVFIPAQSKFSKDTEYDAPTVLSKMLFTPEQVIDFKALRGDPSDNIPGVAGIGQKTACRLLAKYQNLDAILEAAAAGGDGEIIKGGVLQKLQDGVEIARLSRELATVDRSVPIDFDLKNCQLSDYDKTAAVEFCKKLEFKSLIPLLPQDSFETQVQDSLF
jgi:DNA polymerase-1